MSRCNTICSGFLAIFLSGVALSHSAPVRGVANGNFEAGNSLFSSDYQVTDFLCTNGHGGPGTYLLAANPAKVNCYGDWASFGDHTSGSGLMMIIDGSTSTGTKIWSETVKVARRTNYVFSYWTTSVNANGNGAAGNLQVSINGEVVGTAFQMPAAYNGWHQVTVSWPSDKNKQATISLVDLNTSGGWNDFALDDLSLTQQ
jgi:hypothetical protein